MVTKAGESNLQPVAQPAPNKAFQAIPAPFLPPPSALAKSLAPNIGGETSGITLLGAFPNPTQSTSYLNYVVNAAMPVTVRILDSDGREKATLVNAQIQEGAITLVVDIGRLNLPSAQYRYVISTPSGACVRDFTLLR
jgi:carbohydrate-binding DOMON domain-containing protein